MRHPLRAAVGGIVLARVAIAPGSGRPPKAPAKPAVLSVARVGAPPASVQAGNHDPGLPVRVSQRAQPARGRAARMTLSLRPASGAKQRLAGFNVKRP